MTSGRLLGDHDRLGGGVHYDAFISYSQAADGDLAPAIQKGLQRFAKPWQKRTAMRVFRDATGLSATPHLWNSIVDALDETDWFVLLASPGAAESEWVNKEITHFLSLRPEARDHILIVVTEGVCEWDGIAGTFGAATTCIPPALFGVFESEPLYLDLRWAGDDTHLSLRNTDFRSLIAGLASAVRGIPKDELESEDIRIYRKNRRLRRAAIGGLVVLAVGLAAATVYAFTSQRQAIESRNEAEINAASSRLNARRAGVNLLDALSNQVIAQFQAQRAIENAAEAERQQSIAEENATEAGRQELSARATATSALSEQFAAQALSLVDEDPELAGLLAVEALFPDGRTRLRSTRSARNSVGVVARAIAFSPLERRPGATTADLMAVDGTSGHTVTLVGQTLIVRDADRLEIFDLRAPPVDVSIARGGASVLVEDPDGLVLITLDGNEPIDLDGHGGAFSPSGASIALVRDDTIVIVDAASATPITRLPLPDATCPRDEQRLVLTWGSDDTELGGREVDSWARVDEGNCIAELPGRVPQSRRAYHWSVSDGLLLQRADSPTDIAAAWPTGTGGLVLVTTDGSVRVHWAADVLRGSVDEQGNVAGSVADVAVRPDRFEFAVLDGDGRLLISDWRGFDDPQPASYRMSELGDWIDDSGLLARRLGGDYVVLERSLNLDAPATDVLGRAVASRQAPNALPFPTSLTGSVLTASEDRARVLTTEGDILDTVDGTKLTALEPRSLTFDDSAIEMMSFARSDSLVVALSHEHLEVFDAATGRSWYSFDIGSSPGRRFTRGLALDPGGERIAVTGRRGVNVIDLEDGELAVIPDTADTTSVGWSSDGLRLVVGTGTGVVRIVDLDGTRIGPPLIGLNSGVFAVTFSADDERVLAVDGDYGTLYGDPAADTVIVWDASTGAALSRWPADAPVYHAQAIDDVSGFLALELTSVFGFGTAGPIGRFVPDVDPAAVCRQVLDVAADDFEQLVGRRSACESIAVLRAP